MPTLELCSGVTKSSPTDGGRVPIKAGTVEMSKAVRLSGRFCSTCASLVTSLEDKPAEHNLGTKRGVPV